MQFVQSFVPRAARAAVAASLAAALVWTTAAFAQPGPGAARATPCPVLLDHTVPRLQDDKPQHLCQYAGRVLLVVNTASYCGYTPQYEGLEKLNAHYAARGLTVLAFPSNDFRQETSDRRKIEELCFNTYGVKFPIFAPTSVTGPTAHPFFAALAAQAGGEVPKWNFHKYLVDRDGRVVATFPSAVAPFDRRVTSRIEPLLERK
jgi:glutathione peroxidase